MLTVYYSPADLFSSVQFSFSAVHPLEQLSHLQQSPVPLQFGLPVWLLLQMPCPVIGPFIFRVLNCHYQLVVPGQVLCVRLILPCKNFRQLPWSCVECLFGLIRWLPCILITALQNLIYVIKVGWYFLFFPDGPANIEFGWKAQYYFHSSVHSYPSPCGCILSVMGMVASREASSSSYCPSNISTLGSIRAGSIGILIYQSMSAL